MMKVALIGLGSVGKGVAGVIARKDLGLTITGIADSKSGCVDPDGLDIANLLLNKSRNGCCGDRDISAADVIKKADYDALIEVTPTNALYRGTCHRVYQDSPVTEEARGHLE